MDARIKFLRPFKDGNISPKQFKTYEEIIVTDAVLQQLKASGAEVEVIERILPKVTKK